MLLIVLLYSCSEEQLNQSRIEIPFEISDPNLTIEVIASEPDIIAPVSIDFDLSNRIWVAEMQDYMPDINAKGETIPSGRIVILSDKDDDGFYEDAKVFLENIPQLRAIKLFKDGILYADDPNLWFVKIENDLPGERILVDSLYAYGGNVEHKANGLLRNVDHCFYSAKSSFRYCYNEGLDQWNKEATTFRGQWGITADENGRLYVNDNSNFFFGDYFLPNTIIQNKYLTDNNVQVRDLVGSRRVFPIQSTAINRGYEDEMLDEGGKLINATSTCGPHIFNSNGLGRAYNGSAFVCIPEINAIKVLEFDQSKLNPTAVFGLEQSEFLITKDEAFRPVNINTGPDGAIYIVDMHRGIIQHKTYMTKYLKSQIVERGLDTIINYGRILKLTSEKKASSKTNYNWKSQDSLISYLSSENKWLSDKAQEILISQVSVTLNDSLKRALISSKHKKVQIYISWILHLHGNLTFAEINNVNVNSNPWVIANLLKIINHEKYLREDNYIPFLQRMSTSQNPIVLNHLLINLANIYNDHSESFTLILTNILKNGGENILTDAFIAAFPSGIKIDKSYLKLSHHSLEKSLEIARMDYHSNIDTKKTNSIYNPINIGNLGEKDGRTIYNKSCSSCHGIDAAGIKNLAPSLIGSSLINGNPDYVPLILMHGLKGPIHVNDKIENYATVMPAFKESLSLTAQQITQISNYIYNAFSDEVKRTEIQEVKYLDSLYQNKSGMWTEKELMNLEVTK